MIIEVDHTWLDNELAITQELIAKSRTAKAQGNLQLLRETLAIRNNVVASLSQERQNTPQ